MEISSKILKESATIKLTFSGDGTEKGPGGESGDDSSGSDEESGDSSGDE